MRNLFNKALISLIMAVAFASASNALVIDSEYLKAKVTEDLNNKYQQINPDGVVVVKNIPVVNVDLKGTRLAIDCTCDFNTLGKNKLAKISLMENGQTLKVVTIPVEILAYDNVLVATKDIARGESLNSINTRYEKRHIANNTQGVIGENYDYSNLTSQRPIKAGDMVDKRFLAKEVSIFRSNPVVAIFQSGGIKLSIEVTALENGGIGDYIKVKSKEYNKIYQGKVINSNQVLIQIWGNINENLGSEKLNNRGGNGNIT